MTPTTARDDVERFEELYARHRASVYGFLEGLVGNEALAEELTREVFLALFRRLGALGRGVPPAVELLRLAYRVARARTAPSLWSLLRRRQPTTEADGPIPGLRALPLNQRAALLLRDREGLSYEEIAEILDCSLRSVGAWIAAARMRLTGAPASQACVVAAARVSAEFDDRLDVDERAALEQHCRACGSCAQRRAAYVDLRERLRRMVRGTFGAAQQAELFAALRAGRHGNRQAERAFGWIAVASVLLVAWSVVLLVTRASAVPEEPPAASAPKPEPVPVVSAGTLFVLNQTSPGAVTIVDGPTHTVVRRIEVPFRPTSMAWDAGQHRLYLARGQDSVAVLDVDRATLLPEVPLRYPAWSIVLAPDGRSLFASHFTQMRVTQVDLASGRTIREFSLAGRPFSIAPHPNGRWLFVGAAPGSVVRFDIQSGQQLGAYTFDAPVDDGYSRVLVTLSPNGQTVYAALVETGQLAALDPNTGTVRRSTLRVRGPARSAAVSPDGARLVLGYVQARSNRPGVVVVRTDTLKEIEGVAEHAGLGVALGDEGKVLYVSNPEMGLLYAYELATGQLLGATDVGSMPGPLLFLRGE
jgi:DNA-directed RNA polymerase specialized sigma24 family protein/DNA-binding beta-propeller fold protein YncE